MLTETPKRSSASTLSPSVTATSRMLSPKRASRSDRISACPIAARVHAAMRAVTVGLLTCPATVLRATPSRVWTNPNSRSPWAAWLRFMKSMSISDQGSSTLAWVCRCSSGVRSASRPEIHILAGEKVCIQAITPTAPWTAASRQTARMSALEVSTGFQTTRAGMAGSASSCAAICRDWSAT